MKIKSPFIRALAAAVLTFFAFLSSLQSGRKRSSFDAVYYDGFDLLSLSASGN